MPVPRSRRTVVRVQPRALMGNLAQKTLGTFTTAMMMAGITFCKRLFRLQLLTQYHQQFPSLSISPTTLCEGDNFTISGTDLGSASSVTIGGSAAVIISNTNDEILATAQTGSSSGTVEVVASAGSAISSGSVTVNQTPINAAATLSAAGVCSGSTVTLSGSANELAENQSSDVGTSTNNYWDVGPLQQAYDDSRGSIYGV